MREQPSNLSATEDPALGMMMTFSDILDGWPTKGILLLCAAAFAGDLAARAQSPLAPDQLAATKSQNSAQLPDAPTPTRQEPIAPRRLSLAERVDIYRHSITSFELVAGPAFGAAVNQARNEPPEWGQGAAGFGDRFASGCGRMLIGRTIRFGVAAVDHEDPRFHLSNETGAWRRLRYATIHYFIVKTDGGSQIPAFSRFAGVYGAAFISNAWYPASRANTQHAVLRGTTALSAGVAWNVFREFWPDIKDALHGSR